MDVMILLIGIALLIISGEADGKSLWDEFRALKSDVAQGALTEVLGLQSAMLDVIDVHKPVNNPQFKKDGSREDSDLRNLFENHLDNEDMESQSQGEKEGDAEIHNDKDKKVDNNKPLHDFLTFDVHIDVVLIGFPASAVELMRDVWFGSMNREDIFSAHLDGLESAPLPGGLKQRHNFHLVQTSFHVADVLRNRFERLLLTSHELRRKGKGGDKGEEGEGEPLWVNAWEVEELLSSLTEVVSASHRSAHSTSPDDPPLQPHGTVYVFNLDLQHIWDKINNNKINNNKINNKNIPRYSYRAGFSETELQHLAHSTLVLTQAEKVLSNLRTGTRLDLPATATAGRSGSGSGWGNHLALDDGSSRGSSDAMLQQHLSRPVGDRHRHRWGVDSSQVSLNLILRCKDLFLYTVGILFQVEWCTSIAYNLHTDIYPLSNI